MRNDNSQRAASPAGGRPRLTPEARRAQILAAALPCFAQRGYVGTGTRDLARAAGITEPILYRHFGDKCGLFRAVLDQAGERLSAAVGEAVAGATDAPGRLRALAGALPGVLEEHRDALRILAAGAVASEEDEIRAAASACAQRIGQALAAAFRGTGLRRGVRAETAGFLLLEVGLGASTLHPLSVPEMERPDYVERAVAALLHGIVG